MELGHVLPVVRRQLNVSGQRIDVIQLPRHDVLQLHLALRDGLQQLPKLQHAMQRALGHDTPPPDTGALRSDMLAFALCASAWAGSIAPRMAPS